MEQRFSAQARVSIPLAGISGLWLTGRMDLWHRFHAPQFWWMSGMLGLWIFFMLMLFVLEPLLRERFARKAEQAPETVFRRISRLHQPVASDLAALVGADGARRRCRQPWVAAVLRRFASRYTPMTVRLRQSATLREFGGYRMAMRSA